MRLYEALTISALFFSCLTLSGAHRKRKSKSTTPSPVENFNNQTEILCPYEDMKAVDDIVTQLISFTEIQRKFPDTRAKIKPFCKETKRDQIKLDEASKRCLGGSTKHFATVLIYSVGAAIKTYCNPRGKRRQNDMIEMATCVNRPEVGKKLGDLLRTYNDALQRGAVAEPARNRMGYACCYYYKLLTDIETTLAPHCTEKQVKKVGEFVRNLIQSLIDVACLDFSDSSDTCEHLPAPPEKKFKSMVPDAKSFIIPLVDLFSNLE